MITIEKIKQNINISSSVNELAKNLGVSRQALHKFLNKRGYEIKKTSILKIEKTDQDLY